MKKRIYPGLLLTALILLFVTGLSACSDDEPFDTEDKEDIFVEESYQIFDSLLFSENVTLKETLESVIEQYGITDEMLEPYQSTLNLLYALPIHYHVYGISYHTVSPDGKPVKASGVIYYPKLRIPKGVIEINSINKSKGECATELYKMAEVIPGMTGYICLVPDLIGSGISRELPISYMQHTNNAQVSADLRRAAGEFIYNRHHHRLPDESILFGYSLGGSGIMSLARHYTLHPEMNVKINHIFAGGGAYEPYEVLHAQLAANRSDYAIIPNILWSMNYYDHLNLNFEDIFKGELLTHYEEWCQGDISVDRLTTLLGKDLHQYLTDDFLYNLQTSEKYARAYQCIKEKAIPQDWKPSCPVHLFHAQHDYYVPVICGDRMYEYLKHAGADVEYTKFDSSHVEGGVLMLIDFAKFLLDITKPN